MQKFSFNKNKKYKYNKSGSLEEVTAANISADDIVMSGSKSSLRRMADMERNISIIAAKQTNDGVAGDAEDVNYDKTERSDIRFKGDVRIDDGLDMRDAIDMNTNKLTSVGTPTAGSDAATKSYVDAREAAAESTASSDATSKANSAKSQAISSAATDATTKANAALVSAKAYADQAEADAESAAASDATTKANAAQLAAQSFATSAVSNLVNGASAAFNTLSEIQNAMATDAELAAAINGLTIGNGVVTLSAGAGMTGGGAFSMNQTNSETVTMNVIGGNGITVSANAVTMSGSYTGSFTATGDVTAYSDESLKTNIQTIDGALGKVEAVRGVTFDRIADGSTSTGVVAQELLAVLPEAVHTDANGVHSVAYGNITGLLIEAVKELSAEVKELKK